MITETEEVEVSIKSDKRSVKDKDKMLSPFTGSWTASLLLKCRDARSDAVPIASDGEVFFSSAIVGRAHEEEAWGTFTLQVNVECGGLLIRAGVAFGVLDILKQDRDIELSPPADMMWSPEGDKSIAITGSEWGCTEHTALLSKKEIKAQYFNDFKARKLI